MLKTIRHGDKGTEVRVAKLLTEYSGEGDEFDAYFVSHISSWQGKHSADPDGVIGPKTWKAIAASAPTVSIKSLRKGCYAEAVQLLVGADADGIFGRKTKAAVEAYQKDHGLTDDGIVGEKTWSMLICGEVPAPQPTPGEKPVDYKQYDKRWGSKPYTITGSSKQTMSTSACGPTAMADIVATWWDGSVTPWEMAQKALDWGCRTKDSGTSSAFLKKAAKLYDAKDYRTSSSADDVIKCLREGGLVIVCFGAGTKGKAGYQKWTKGGHYCLIWKWDGEKFHINDPASAASARATGTRTEVMNTRKGFYLFWRKDA